MQDEEVGAIIVCNNLEDKKETLFLKGDFTDITYDEKFFPEAIEFTVEIKFTETEDIQPNLSTVHAEFQFDPCMGFGTEIYSTKNNLTVDSEDKFSHSYDKKFQIPKMT